MNMFKKILAAGIGVFALCGIAFGQANHVTISQIYGAGGNSGAVYNADYVELFNPTSSAVNIGGWAIQYASSAGNFSATSNKIDIPANTMIAANSYFLVKLSTAGATGSPLTPDLDSTAISAAAGAGKLVLLNSNAYLTNGATGSCPTAANIVDFVGYGTGTTCFEGSGPTATLSATLAAFRVGGGCTDANNNAADFSTGTPAPRNSMSATNSCQSAQPPTGSGSSTPASACPSASINLTFTVTPGVPANAIASVVGDGSSIGAGTINFTNSSGNTWTANNVVIASSTTTGAKSIPVTINEVGGRTGSGAIGVTVSNCTLGLTTGTGFAPNTVCLGTPVTFTAVVRKNQITTTSTGITATIDLTFLGGGQVPMTDLGDDANNPNLRDFSLTYTVPQSAGAGMQLVTVNIADAQGNTANGSYTVPTVNCANASSDIVISQLYGGGGATTGSPTYKVDYVELFNRSSAPVTMTNWALQYASASGPTGTPANWLVSGTFSGTIPAGGYYLVSFTQGGSAIGADLPVAADAVPTPALSMGATDGKVALTTDNTPLVSATPSTATVKDLIGYGSSTTFEGAAAAPGLTNQLANFRRGNGCQDFDQNGADFAAAAPAPRTSASPLNNCAGGGPTGVCCRGATCNTTVAQASCTTSGATAGATFVSSASTCNATATSNTPCCSANYNKTGGVTVQDIFDFLADWFAGSPYANTGGNGTPGALNVQNIFDFLSAWFAGGC